MTTSTLSKSAHNRNWLLLCLALLVAGMSRTAYSQTGSVTGVALGSSQALANTPRLPSVSPYHGNAIPVLPGPIHPPQPVSDVGAAVYLFSFQSTPNGEVPVSLLTDDGSGVVQQDAYDNGYILTDTSGNFDVTGLYAAQCPTPTAPIYMLALGGDIGYGVNPSYAGMSAFPVACSQLPNVSGLAVNELTTIAAAYVFSPFSFTSEDDEFFVPNASEAALNYLFAYANDYVNGLTGNVNTVTGDGGTVPVLNINTLADILTTCTQTSDPDPCTALFNAVSGSGPGHRPTPNGMPFVPTTLGAPSDTLMAAIQIATTPTYNVSGIYSLLNSTPFQPVLSAAPADWTIPISYNTTAQVNITSSTNPAAYCQPVTLTATVSIPNPPPISIGVVEFYDNLTFLGMALTSGLGNTASITLSNLSVGPHQITAYLVAPATATSTPFGQIVMQGTPSISEQSSANPAPYGSSVTLSAPVVCTNPTTTALQPTGTVAFDNGTTLLGSSTIGASSTAALSLSNLAAGTDTLTAQYGGDANYLGATSSPIAENISMAPTTTSLTASTGFAFFGQTVTLSTTVMGSNPTGTVLLSDGAGFSQPISLSQGAASFPATTLSIGVHNITATYGGDSNNLPSISNTVQVTVQITSTTTTVNLMPSSSFPNTPITANISVVGSIGGISPVGSVSCSMSGNSQALTAQPLVGGVAKWSITPLAIGQYTITCSYTPSTSNFAPSTSQPVVETVAAVPTPTWTSDGPMYQNLPLVFHTATLLPTGGVLIAGGTTTGNGDKDTTSAAQIYTPGSGFAITGSMFVQRNRHTATLLNNGKVLVVGGENYNNSSNAPGPILTSAEVYDPAPSVQTFSPGGNLHSPRTMHTATKLTDGTVLIAGGSTGGAGQGASPIGPAEIYTLQGGATPGVFAVVGTMQTPRTQHTATLLQSGLVLIVGGVDGNNYTISSAELYNPSTQTFQSTGSLNQARCDHTATLLPNGMVLIAGGVNNGNVISEAEIYNPANGGSFTNVGSMQTARFAHQAELLSDGTVLLTGGATSAYTGATTGTTEIFQYGANGGTSSYGPSLNAARSFASDVVLADGTVLTTGGFNASGSGVEVSAETYNDESKITGVIQPKYVVLGVTYAPPGGLSSYVSYADTTFMGVTNMVTNTTTTTQGLSVSIASDEGTGGGGAIPAGWLDGQETGTASTTWTQTATDSQAISMTGQTSTNWKTLGTPDAFGPVDHNYDIIWIWVNPVVQLTVSASKPAALPIWNGYGFDYADPAHDVDVIPVYVGYLKNNQQFLPNSQADHDLARTWVTGQYFPNGDGPGLTQADKNSILLYDPFQDPSYTVPTANGVVTSPDGRFTRASATAGGYENIPYLQEPQTNFTYAETYTSSTVDTHLSINSTNVSWSVSEKFTGSFFIAGITYTSTQSGSVMFQSMVQKAITNTTTQAGTLYILGPPCSGSPCDPLYVGGTTVQPNSFNVYQDTVFGSFMFLGLP